MKTNRDAEFGAFSEHVTIVNVLKHSLDNPAGISSLCSFGSQHTPMTDEQALVHTVLEPGQ